MNIKYALRSIRKNPLVTVIAVASLALGIGANTAIFSLIDQLLLRMLPVENPQELVQLAPRAFEIGASWGDDTMSYPMYRDFRDKASVFAGVVAWHATPISLSYGGRSERIRCELVTGDYFQVLGVKTAVGRTFTPEDNETPGAEPFAILGYDFWQSRFGADPNVVGRTIHLNGQPMTIVGVSARDFHGLEVGAATQVFVPMMMQPQMKPVLSAGLPRPVLEFRRSRWINVVARLKPGVSIEQARNALAPLYRQIIEMEVQEPAFQRASESTRQDFLRSRIDIFNGSTGRSGLRRGFTAPLYVLMAITGLVLLIACANVANLLMGRATARQKEIAVRLALGAGRAQIVTQLMTENLLLAAMAAAAGLGLGVWMNQGLLQFLSANNSPLTLTSALDRRVLAFSLLIAFCTAFIFGLAPAFQATRTRLSDTLKSQAGNIFGGRGHARARKALVIAQVSVSLLLLIASSLFVRSLSRLHDLDPGFRTDRLIAFSIDTTLNAYTSERAAAFYPALLDRLRALPGVTSVGQATVRVLEQGNFWRNAITVEDYNLRPDERVTPLFNAVSLGYFNTLGIAVMAGRDFDTRDVRPDSRVCIVNETFARKYFQDGRALGRHIGLGNRPGTKTDVEVVGIVHDAKYDNRRDDTPGQVFIPLTVSPGTVVYLRTAGDPSTLFGAVQSVVRAMDESLPVYDMRTLEEQVDRSLITERMIATLSTAFGSIATLLAVIGLYGVMAFAVARRAREIGIRISLGAQSSNVLGMMMREVALVMLSGIAIGIPVYLALARYLRSQLYGIQPNDPLHILAAALFLFAVGLIAGYIPSRRALRVDPIRILRYE